MQFSKRMAYFKPGIFSVLAQMREERMAQGLPVIDLSVGTPNIPPAQHIVDALLNSARNRDNYVYAISDTDRLQKAAAQWYARRYGVQIDPAREVASLLGVQEGLAHIAFTAIDEGDTMLLPDPSYPIFLDGPVLAGARPYRMPQKKENGYLIDVGEIPEAVARRAKLMILSYPNNPTASIAPDSLYSEVIAFAKRYRIIVIHDNSYSELVFDGQTCGSFLRFPGAKDVGVEFNSLSKTYGLAGARIGFAVGNPDVIGMLKTLKSNIDYGMFLPLQDAAIAAVSGPQDCVEATRKEYQSRRDFLVDGLNKIGWTVRKSPATMFLWARIPEGYTDSFAFTRELLDKAGVLLTPGTAFGKEGEGHVRMALIADKEELAKAINMIEKSGILSDPSA
ncbi:MAG: aminotransferase class I/II-fold pyridoxal phosphate-dependent enzyme [Clostridiales bacterium]|nr:aminotransferase class I/II-fold pyridoxal phosphate-dependent enzyme [Clostridiales bacterium]